MRQPTETCVDTLVTCAVRPGGRDAPASSARMCTVRDLQLPPLLHPTVTAAGYLAWDQTAMLGGELAVGGNVNVELSGHGGGSSANVADGVAAVGGSARFVGHAGNDALGDTLVSQLEARGVTVDVHRAGRSSTIVCLVHPGGQRTFLFDPGHALELTPDDVSPSWIADVGVLHLTSFALFTEPSATAMRSLVARAHDAGIRVTLDAGAANAIEDFGVDRYIELLGVLRPTVLFCNAEEATALGLGLRPPTGVDIVVVHRGADSTLAYGHGHAMEAPVPDVNDVVDTTGAGDAFAAGFLAAWADGSTLGDAVDAANRLAVQVLGAPGARLPIVMPTTSCQVIIDLTDSASPASASPADSHADSA